MNRDELIRALGEAIEEASLTLIGRDLGTAFRDDIAAAGLDAVLPLIEADVRESIATEIDGWTSPTILHSSDSALDQATKSGIRFAALIARGEQA